MKISLIKVLLYLTKNMSHLLPSEYFFQLETRMFTLAKTEPDSHIDYENDDYMNTKNSIIPISPPKFMEGSRYIESSTICIAF